MPDLGKVDPEFLASYVLPRLGATRDDVRLGPTPGVDFGVVDVGGEALVVATDPFSVVPDLRFARAGWFGLQICLADVAVSGIAPSHLTVSFSLPPATTDDEFAELWGAVDDVCDDLGVAIVGGHTARYPDAEYPWVGAATVLGVGDNDDVIRPDGARPGDSLLVTNGPAVETTGLFATLFPEAFDDLDEATLRAAQDRLADVALVEDALAAADAGRVTAMHDATEGGLRNALVELAAAADVGLEVDSAAVPIQPGVAELCDALGVDPWTATTAGTLLIAVDAADVENVLAAVSDRGTPVAEVGRVTDGSRVLVDGEPVDAPDADPTWAAYDRLSDGS